MCHQYPSICRTMISKITSVAYGPIQVRIYTPKHSIILSSAIIVNWHGRAGVLLEGTQKIVIDGGMAKFKLLKGDDPDDYFEVPDLRK